MSTATLFCQLWMIIATLSRSVYGKKDAAAIILLMKQNDGILMLQANNKDKRWMIPAGEIDPGETPEDAAVREFFEETGFYVPESAEYFDQFVYKSDIKTTLYMLKSDEDPKLLIKKFKINSEAIDIKIVSRSAVLADDTESFEKEVGGEMRRCNQDSFKEMKDNAFFQSDGKPADSASESAKKFADAANKLRRKHQEAKNRDGKTEGTLSTVTVVALCIVSGILIVVGCIASHRVQKLGDSDKMLTS